MQDNCIQSGKWIRDLDHLRACRIEWRMGGKSVCATNGVFDILHLGHVQFLRQCKALATARMTNILHWYRGLLLVGVNDDASVRELKGPGRPVNPAFDRLDVLAELECVNYVCLFSGKRATEFLAAAQPDIWVKAG